MRSYKVKIKTADQLYKLTWFIRNNFADDSLRLRAAFIWITENIAYDIKGYSDEKKRTARIEDVIIKKKAVCGGYAALIKYFGDAFNIENEIIEGCGRSLQSHIVMRQTKLPLNHAWNAVKINGTWRLIDATWASGGADDTEEENMKFIKEYDETYYFTSPEKFVLNHLPLNPRFQYTENTRGQNRFMNSPLYQSGFLKPEIASASPDTALIKVKVGDTLTFRIKSDLRIMTIIAFSRHSEMAKHQCTPNYNDGWFEMKYPVKVSGSYNLFIGGYDKNEIWLPLLAYKLEVRS